MGYDEDEHEPPDVITSDTENATQVRPSEAPAQKERLFTRLAAYNKNTWNGPKRENKEVTHRQDDLQRYDAISSKLFTSRYRKERGRKFMDEVDFHEFGESIDHIIFGICAVVANDDVDNGTRHWPQHPRSRDDEFSEIGESLGLSPEEQLSAMEKIRSRIDM